MSASSTKLRLVVVCTALGLGVVGCGSDDAKDEPSTHAAATPTNAAPRTAANGVALDACSMLSSADITPLIGKAVEGKATSTDPDAPGCVWENPDTYTSVTLNIGAHDTAPNGVVPEEPSLPKTPGPDGIEFYGPGAAEFVAGGRLNDLQVANGASSEDTNAAVIALVRKVKPQIGG